MQAFSKNFAPIALSGVELLGFQICVYAFQRENSTQTLPCLYCDKTREPIEFLLAGTCPWRRVNFHTRGSLLPRECWGSKNFNLDGNVYASFEQSQLNSPQTWLLAIETCWPNLDMIAIKTGSAILASARFLLLSPPCSFKLSLNWLNI